PGPVAGSWRRTVGVAGLPGHRGRAVGGRAVTRLGRRAVLECGLVGRGRRAVAGRGATGCRGGAVGVRGVGRGGAVRRDVTGRGRRAIAGLGIAGRRRGAVGGRDGAAGQGRRVGGDLARRGGVLHGTVGQAAPTRAAAAAGSPSIGSTRSWLTPRTS